MSPQGENGESALEIRGLTRKFRTKVALNDVTLSIPKGCVFGLVGENGAGKTTLIKHMMGLLKPQSGSVAVFGHNPVTEPESALSRIGYLSEDRDLPGWMRINELMRYTQGFYPNWDEDFAEDAGVRLQLHPNDPPVTHAGVARLFRSVEGYQRAMEIADHSPYSGILFCTGSFGQMFGPDGKGEDVEAAIRHFGSQGHIYQVHYRNVSSNIPNFHETFPDNGYQNMYKLMKALGEVNFNGIVCPDHVPEPLDSKADKTAAEAYIFGYIRAAIQAVNTELGLND